MNVDKKYEVVISGISGLYPECDDVDELWNRLMKGDDLVTVDERRWAPGEFDVPPGTGKINHPGHFDMTFFGIHKKLCEKMDPYSRLSCEQGIRAICDAGVNLRDLDGTNTAVIMSSAASETELELTEISTEQGTYSVLAVARTMQANRLSYFLNTTGPSFAMDSSTCGGIQAIKYAYDLISTGECVAAIVGSCSLLYKGEVSFHYQAMGRLSNDCKTRSFSSDASGFARSEGCVTMFLQRKDIAKRIYGTVLGANVFTYGAKDVQYCGFPRGLYDKFLDETYKKFNVDPKELVYVEAHGAASKTLDALELNSLSAALLKDRSEPLLIGSVKSNLGHTEGCSSMVSLTKVLMALDRGVIPPNINYSQPNPDVPALVNGKLKVVTEPTPIEGGTVAICELGVIGSCGHLIIKGNDKPKPAGVEKAAALPYLITMSGRSETGLANNMKYLENKGVDGEFVVLANSLYRNGIKNHVCRGYTVISGEPNTYNKIEPSPTGQRRPIWFMYSGMGSQWPTMAKSLMALPIFANAINKCHKILQPKGVDLLDILCRDDPSIFDNILNSFVGISAVQIALTDVLRAVGVEPDGIIGHSVGELGCAYADGCMTAEQMILAAHARGRASVETKLVKGMMAAVGAGYRQIKDSLPETIEVACHNSQDSCTLSGPAEDMEAFIAQLKAKGMFAKLVNVANIAYHSRGIKPAAPALLKYLKEIIPVPVKRSSKWVSTSCLEANWNTHLAQHSSAEYHTNNLLSSVLFEEASSHIPSDAIVIEIAPHGLLQAIVKRSLPQAIHIPLTNRLDKDNLMFLLGAIGKMFIAGIPVDLRTLYPTAEFPVSRGTPAISPLIDWIRDHKFDFTRVFSDPDASSPYCRFVSVDVSQDGFRELLSHKICGKSVLPNGFYFREIIDLFNSFGNNVRNAIRMEKIKFISHAEIKHDTSTELRIHLSKGRGTIDVTNNLTGEYLLEGIIRTTDDTVKDVIAPRGGEANIIRQDEILSLMKYFGAEWHSSNVSLDNVSVSKECAFGSISWDGDIGKFLMSHLLLSEFIESKNSNVLKLFHSAIEITINLPLLNKSKVHNFTVEYNFTSKTVRSEGVRIALIECRNPGLSQVADVAFSLEVPQFVPYVSETPISHEECVNTCIQLVFENTVMTPSTVINVAEVGKGSPFHKTVNEVVESVKYAANTSLTLHSTEESFVEHCSSSVGFEGTWVLCTEPLSAGTLKSIAGLKNCFLLSPKCEDYNDGFRIVFEAPVGDKWYALYAVKNHVKRQYEVLSVNNGYLTILKKHLSVLEGLVSTTDDDQVKTILLWGEIDSMAAVENILEETKDLPSSQLSLRYWLFQGTAPEVDLNNSEFKAQIARDVRMNILVDGKWGSIGLKPSDARNVDVSTNTSLNSKFYYPLSAVAASHNMLAIGLNLDDNTTDITIQNLGVFDYVTSNKKMGAGVFDPNSKSFTPDNILSWQKPTLWTSKEAATVPVLYSLASYIMHQIYKAPEFSHENSILVNQALLPLSQAVISLAIFEKMDVHATVYGEEEKQKLLTLFPKLSPKNIYDCSSVGFFVEVLKNTDGVGVYKVINNFDDPVMISPCAECTSSFGVLVYASQALINNGAVMGMLRFDTDVIAKAVSADIVMSSPDCIKLEIKANVTKALQGGGVAPIQAVVSLPPSTLNTDATAYLKSSKNKVVVDTNVIDNSIFLQADSECQVVVEGKIQVDLSLDIVEWLLKRGSRKVLLFSRQNHLEVNSLRFQSLCKQYSSAEIQVRPSNQLSTKVQVQKFVDEFSTPKLAKVFFLGSGLKERMEFFDEVLSSKFPYCNMICIGKGGESVCERRKLNSLPALYIRCSTANLEGINLVHYLDSLIKDSSKSPVVLVKKWAVQSKSLQGLLPNMMYVPDTKEELAHLVNQSKVSTIATFVDIASDGPPAQENRDVYPMFFIPGLRPNRLHKLASQLFCPAMEARIPANATSIDHIANDLSRQLLALPHNMFTLCAEGWGGLLALHLAQKLEEKSKYVNVILLDATPVSVRRLADGLLGNEATLIKRYLHLPHRVESDLKNASWDDGIKFALAHSQLKGDNEKLVAVDSLNIVRRRLLSVVDAKPPSKKMKILCHVFRLSSSCDEDLGLDEYLLKEPVVHSMDSKTADQMINSDVALDVNTLLLYEHKDAANPPIEEYLGCDVVKKYLPHWKNSILHRVRE